MLVTTLFLEEKKKAQEKLTVDNAKEIISPEIQEIQKKNPVSKIAANPWMISLSAW